MARGLRDSSAAQDCKPWPVWAEAPRAKPPGCLARSRRSQTRRAGCNGSGLWWRRSSHQATTSPSSSAAVFDVPLRCRMFYRHASVEERHCFDDVCSGVRLGSSSLIGLSRNAVPRGIWGGWPFSMRRAAQTTSRGSSGSCWCGEPDARTCDCQIRVASDIGRAPDASETNGDSGLLTPHASRSPLAGGLAPRWSDN